MATARPFAYNLGAGITGTTQVGSLAVGTPTAGFTSSPQFWNGPDEDLGYVIAHPVSSGTQPTPVPGITAYLGFNRTSVKTDPAFITLAQYVASTYSTPQSFTTANEASLWLTDNGFWNSYPATPTLAGSLVFNGSNQSLSISPGVTFGANTFTVEGWFYNDQNFNNKGILGVPVSNTAGALNLFFDNNTTISSDKNGGGGAYSYTMASAISTNAWHYLIYNSNSDGKTAVYIDGVRSTNTEIDTYNYTGATDTIGRYYGGSWSGYWTNMRITIGTAVYDSNLTTQPTPTAPLTVLANTKYLMLGATVTTDSSGVQTVTNNNGVTQSSADKPF